MNVSKGLTAVFMCSLLVTTSAIAQKVGHTYNIQLVASKKNLQHMLARQSSAIAVWTNSGESNQEFTLIDAGEAFFFIKAENGQVIEARKNSGESDVNLVLSNPSDLPSQKWEFIKDGNTYNLLSESGVYLGVLQGLNTLGEIRVPINDFHRWQLIDVSISKGEASVLPLLSPTQIPNNDMIVFSPDILHQQFIGKTFFIEFSGDGDLESLFLINKRNNSAGKSSISAQIFTAETGQNFTFKDAGSGYVYIITKSNKYFTVGPLRNKPSQGADFLSGPLLAEDYTGNDNQKWKVKFGGDKNRYVITSKNGLSLYNGWSRTTEWTMSISLRKGGKRPKKSYWLIHDVRKPLNFKRSFKLDPIKNLCPNSLINGDREFASNGPLVSGTVRFSFDKNNLEANIKFKARETKSDWSEVKGEWTKRLFSLPAQWTITDISSGRYSSYSKLLVGGGKFEPIEGPFGSGHKINGNAISPSTGPLRELYVVGDTGGNDISDDTDCSGDTSILTIRFNPVLLDITYSK